MERILVVDDEFSWCHLLVEFLITKGYEVYTAVDGPSAIHNLNEIKPHIVLLDTIMPRMDGWDVLKEIRKIDADVVVVMMGGKKEDERSIRNLKVGAFEHILKPVNFDTLEKVIKAKMLDH
jgi:DNA-binding response OmpR family regulator